VLLVGNNDEGTKRWAAVYEGERVGHACQAATDVRQPAPNLVACWRIPADVLIDNQTLTARHE
jgi:hypothetical protein